MRLRARPGMTGHHGEPVAGGFLHQDRHELPGRMGVEPVVHIVDHLPDNGGVDCGELPRKSLCDMFNCVAFGIGNHLPQPERPTRGPSIQQPVNRSARPDRLDHAPTPLSSPHRRGNRETRHDSSHSSILSGSCHVDNWGNRCRRGCCAVLNLCTTDTADPLNGAQSGPARGSVTIGAAAASRRGATAG
jgi:hypothetical protein